MLNLFSGMPNVCSIADDILVSGFEEPGRDHDATLDNVLEYSGMPTWKLEQRWVSFQVHQSIPYKSTSINRHATVEIQKRMAAIFGHT